MNSIISNYASKAKKQYEKKERLLKNPDENDSDFFASRLKACRSIEEERNREISTWNEVKPQVQQVALKRCSNKGVNAHQYGGFYKRQYEDCIYNYVEDEYERYVTVNTSEIDICRKSVSSYEKGYKSSKRLELQRDEYYGVEPSVSSSDVEPQRSERSRQLPLNFDTLRAQVQQQKLIAPYSMQQMGQRNSQQYNPYPQMNPNRYSMYPQMNPNRYSMYPQVNPNRYSMYPQNFNGSQGVWDPNNIYGTRTNQPFGYQQPSSPGVYPTYPAPGQINPNLIQSQAGIGGSYNFTYR